MVRNPEEGKKVSVRGQGTAAWIGRSLGLRTIGDVSEKTHQVVTAAGDEDIFAIDEEARALSPDPALSPAPGPEVGTDLSEAPETPAEGEDAGGEGAGGEGDGGGAASARIVEGVLARAETLAEVKAVLGGLSEAQLAFVGQAAYELGVERARGRGDLDQLVADAMERSFDSRDGLGVMPWVSEGVLWAPGARVEKSQSRHACRFVRVKGATSEGWVWEGRGVLRDTIRRSESPRAAMTSMTLVALELGAEVDVVTSESVGGAHRAKRIDSFEYDGEELVRTNTRRITATDHR